MPSKPIISTSSGTGIPASRTAVSQYAIDLDANLVCYGDYTIRSGYECMAQIIQSNIHFDAIIAANDFMAIGALAAVQLCLIRCSQAR